MFYMYNSKICYYVICVKYGSKIFCMKNILDFMFCSDMNYGDIIFVNGIIETMFFYSGSSVNMNNSLYLPSLVGECD